MAPTCHYLNQRCRRIYGSLGLNLPNKVREMSKLAAFISRYRLLLTLGLVLAWLYISNLNIGKCSAIHRNHLIPTVAMANHILLVACNGTGLQWSIRIWYTMLNFMVNVSCLLTFTVPQLLMVLAKYVGLHKIVLLVNPSHFPPYFIVVDHCSPATTYENLSSNHDCVYMV